MNVFQKTEGRQFDLYDIPGYKALDKYMAIVGQSPLQTNRNRKIRLAVFLISGVSLLIPSMSQFIKSMSEYNIDGMMDCVPAIAALIASLIKLINHNMNREKYKQLFKLVRGEWESLRFNDEISVLNQVSGKGTKIAEIYRRTLLSFLVLFLSIPLTPVFLDIVLPLNETRPRRQIFQLNYIFVDSDDYFYPIYLHMVSVSISTVIIIVTIDSSYMVLVHHACGFFAVRGYQIKQETENASGTVDSYQRFRQYVIGHNKALQFYEVISSTSRNSYLLQIGLNMIAITVTAVQIIMHLNELEEVLRVAMFFAAQKFHLLVLSLPGQTLVDYSLGLADDIYFSKWYQTPVKIQKMLYVMKIKSSKPCIITAGGLYQMNIENFGVIVKTSMSYFMMLMSLRE